MPLTVATWNVNSVRKRLDQVARFAHATAIDVLCLQETKVVNDLFPVDALTEAGFPYQAITGMKGTAHSSSIDSTATYLREDSMTRPPLSPT